MKDKARNYKTVLFVLFVLAILLPVAKKALPFWRMKQLAGYTPPAENPKLNLETWFNGNFQGKEERYLEETIGLKEFFVRLYNEWNYILFEKINSSGLINGKNNQMFEELYIKTYKGDDFLGDEVVQYQIHKLKAVQDTLSKLNIPLYLVIAPGKAVFMPENLPDSLVKVRKKTNYETFRDGLTADSVKFIDVQQWFLDMKDTTKYPLFATKGIHWSYYGDILVADSLITFLQQEMPTYNFPQIVIDSILYSTTIRHRDDDLWKLGNFFFNRPNNEFLAYPIFHFTKQDTSRVPRVLVVGDSFYWEMYDFGMSSEVFNDGEFWHYNWQAHQTSKEEAVDLSIDNRQERLEQHQAIVIMTTDMNLRNFCFGLIDQLYEVYYSSNK